VTAFTSIPCEEILMHRALRILMLLVVAGSIMGCGEDTAVNTTPASPVAAKEAAAKMPPPPAMPGPAAK
jgi:hypothetical protein